MLVLATGLLVGGWLVDGMLISPGLAWLGKVRAEAEAATKAVQDAQALVDRQSRIMGDWRSRHASGLLDDEDGVRHRVQQALVASARSSAFAIDSVSGSQRVPAAHGHAYDLLRMTVTGQGSLSQAQAFLAGIETAPVALRIERCEWAARDARKDHMDLSLTLSTRIVAATARGGRSVPDGTPAWKPDSRDGTLDAATLAAKPFQADRRSANRDKKKESPREAAPPAVTVTAGGWALVGIVATDTGSEAFLRHLGEGKERVVRVGDAIGEAGAVTAIEASVLCFTDQDQEHRIAVGHDLTGNAIAADRLSSPIRTPTTASGNGSSRWSGRSSGGATTPTPAPTASPFQVPSTTAANPDAESILQRLRQQRSRASGAAP